MTSQLSQNPAKCWDAGVLESCVRNAAATPMANPLPTPQFALYGGSD
jgi:hypothetical protein